MTQHTSAGSGSNVEQELIDERTRLGFLCRAAAALNERADAVSALRHLAELAVPSCCDWCVVEVMDARGEVAHRIIAHPDPAKIALAQRMIENYAIARDPAKGGGWVMATGQSLLVSRVDEAHLRTVAVDEAHFAMLSTLCPRSYLIVPLESGDRVVGTLTWAMAESGRTLGARDVDLCAALAELAMIALENARHFEEAKSALDNRRDLLSVVSHDVRNPLGVIAMQATLLDEKRRRGLVDDAELCRAIDRIRRSCKQIERLVDDLLDLGRIDAGQMGLTLSDHALAPLLEEAVEIARPVAEQRRIELTLEIEPRVGTCCCDRGRVLQVLSNLIGNALKFTGEGGHVRVAAAKAGARVRIAVEDDGPGIPPEQQQNIFQRRWQGHAGKRGGVGLGLPIARGIVEAHGGRLTVESTPGRGSRFVIELPTLGKVQRTGAAPLLA